MLSEPSLQIKRNVITLHKIPEFDLIYWCENILERHSFCKVLGKSPHQDRLTRNLFSVSIRNTTEHTEHTKTRTNQLLSFLLINSLFWLITKTFKSSMIFFFIPGH